MPIKKIKAQSPDPYLGKIKGDTELARLAHLNHIVDQINAQGSGGGGGGGVVQVDTFNDLPTTGQPDVLYIVRNSQSCSTCPFPGNSFYYWNSQTNSYFVPGLRIGGSSNGSDYSAVEGVNNLSFGNGFLADYGVYSFAGNAGYFNVRLENPRLDRAYRALVTRKTFDWPGYGYLYNWYAVGDPRNIVNPAGGTGLTAPNQWRVPSQTDWNVLTTFVGTNNRIKLSSVLQTPVFPYDSQYGWVDYGTKGTDDYNFNVLPAGFRATGGEYSNSVGVLCNFWTSTSSGPDALIIQFYLFNYVVNIFNLYKGSGNSLRLVREATAGELLLADGDTSDTSSLDPYTGNDGTTYTTVKINTQIWLAENLIETLYNNLDPVTNLSSVGGDSSDGAWINAGNTSLEAYTIGRIQDYLAPGAPFIDSKYAPETNVSQLFNDVRENTLINGSVPYWIETVDGVNPVYQLELFGRKWKKTFINVKPTYDTTTYNNGSSSIEQRSLIVKSAETCADVLEFFPVNLSTNAIEDLAGDGAVYLEILEYRGSASTLIVCPGEGSGSSGGGGVGLSLLELQNQDFENLSQFLGLGVEQI